MSWHFVIIMAALALSACDSGAGDTAGGVSQSESDALNNAAEVLDAQATPPRVAEDAAK